MFSHISSSKNNQILSTSISEDVRLLMTLYWLCDGDKVRMDHFYDNTTEADLLLFSYLKIDSIKSGTNSNYNKLI